MEPTPPALTVSHERPVMDATPSVSPAEPSVSEYTQHRIARGMSEAPKALETPAAEPTPTPEEPVAAAPVNPLAGPPEPAEEPEAPEPTVEAKGPEATNHRWKDPDTGQVLDLRRRDHRRMKRLLEERSAFAARLRDLEARMATPPPTTPERTQEPPRALSAPDPSDPEPTLEQFADQPDPYAAHMRAVARWEARQEFKQQQSARASVERTQQTTAAIASAQEAFDAKLPEIRQRYPDFDHAHSELVETLGRVPEGRRAAVVHRLLTSPVRHELAYYLGNHPDDLARLTNARTPHEQAIALGAIEASVQHSLKAAPAEPSTTRAPAPITPVNSGAPAVRRDAEALAKEGDYQAYRAARGMPGTRMTAAR